MNILVVDDDRFVLEGLRKGIQWDDLPFENIYMVQSVKQAKTVLEKVPISVLVSDIEMPVESGLDLLAWSREKRLPVECILLTSYAEFSYAQKAVELGIFRYFLKPIEYMELQKIIVLAAEKAEETIESSELLSYKDLWLDQTRNIQENFFLWLVQHAKYIDRNELLYQVNRNKLHYSPEECIQVILCEITPEHKQGETWKESLREFIFRNVSEELFATGGMPLFSVVHENSNRYYMIVGSEGSEAEEKRLDEILAGFVASGKKVLQSSMVCIVSDAIPLMKIGEVVDSLDKIAVSALSWHDTVIKSNEYILPQTETELPEMKELEILMENGNLDGMMHMVNDFLDSAEKRHITSEALLRSYKYDIDQMIYARLSRDNIDAHMIMGNRNLSLLETSALRSTQGMKKYLQMLFGTVIEYGRFYNDRRSLSEKLIAYVEEHIGDNISRSDLASYVYLNEDYLARVFKQETGVSIGNYILSKKMERARILLNGTDKSVNVIAQELGYESTSYFAKMFRRTFGMVPNAYRKQFRPVEDDSSNSVTS